ncbi:MAG: hemF, partial [Francisellaceae bacterium]|nr:hemF [Francisellaceae bacterium]
MTKNFYLIKNFLLDYQFQLTKVLENIDTAQTFFRDSWNSDIGEGITCSLSDGKLLERCGINFSHIKGEKLPLAATLKRPELKNHHYEVLGVSVVIHPTNPFVPSAHCNVRFFNAHCPQQGTIWWFGGGFDLTPYYGFK